MNDTISLTVEDFIGLIAVIFVWFIDFIIKKSIPGLSIGSSIHFNL